MGRHNSFIQSWKKIIRSAKEKIQTKLATSIVLKTGSFESDLVSCDFPSYMYNRFSGYVRPGLFE